MGCMNSKGAVVTTAKLHPDPAPANPKDYASNHIQQSPQEGNSSTTAHKSANDVVSSQQAQEKPANQPEIHANKPASGKIQVHVKLPEEKNDKGNSGEGVGKPKEKEQEKSPEKEKEPRVPRFKAEDNQIINQHKEKGANDYVSPQKNKENAKIEQLLEREIYPNFKKIGVEKYDELFSEATKILRGAEQTRIGIEDAKEKVIGLSNVALLKEESLKEVVQVLFWTISANHEGKINTAGVEIHSEGPFMKLNKLKMKTDEAQELYDLFSQYLQAVNQGPSEVEKAEKSLIELNQKILELKNSTEGDIGNSSLKDTQKAKVVQRLDRYSHVYLPKELAKVARLIPIIEKEIEGMKGIVPKLQEMLDAADEVGGKVYEEYAKQKGEGENTEMDEDIEYILAPAQIFNKYNKEEKKDLKEMDNYNKELKRRKDDAQKERINRQKEDQD